MATKLADRTHCVTFFDGKDKFYAVKSREYGDATPMGVAIPELRCAMTQKDASKLAAFIRKESSFFREVRVNRIPIKPVE